MASTATEHYEHAYPLGNDVEAKRLRNQHDVIKDAMGGLVLAPLDFATSPLKILDSATADGTWIRDLAATHPNANHEYTGTDINPAEFPVEPPSGTIYQVHDINKPWPEDWAGRFDFVHQRLVLVSGGANQEQALHALGALVKPGGWIQVIEATNELPEGCGPVMQAFVNVMNGVFGFMGADLKLTDKMPGWLRGTGFVDIQDRIVPLRLGASHPDATLAARGVFSTSAAAGGLGNFAKTLPQGTVSLTEDKLSTLGVDLEKELKELGGIYPLRVRYALKTELSYKSFSKYDYSGVVTNINNLGFKHEYMNVFWASVRSLGANRTFLRAPRLLPRTHARWVYFVLADPSVEKRLRKNLREITAKYLAEVPRWADLEKIPYLAGCIKEGLRLARLMRRSPRISPDQDLIYKQWIIPKNTPLAMSVCHLHMDPDVYPEPYKFILERWMGDVDPRVTGNFVPFVKGSRNCLGFNLAWSELYIVLAIIFRPGGHKMSLDCDESDIVPVCDSDVGVPKSDSRGLRVRFH